MTGNHMIDSSDPGRWSIDGGKCPDCGSRRIVDCKVCTEDEVGECAETQCWREDDDRKNCDCQRDGCKCENCGKVWREE